jgi:hypothetical protein
VEAKLTAKLLQSRIRSLMYGLGVASFSHDGSAATWPCFTRNCVVRVEMALGMDVLPRPLLVVECFWPVVRLLVSRL